MLHCASNANVVRPLAFDAGVLPDWATGVGVAQIHGVVCEPSSTGPPIGWLVITRRASRPPWLSPATKSLRPARRPLTSPRSVRAAALALNAPVTSRSFSDSRTLFSATPFGTRTSTRASPPLMRSARFDSVTISKLDAGRSSPACAVTRNNAPSARNDSFMEFIVSSSLRRRRIALTAIAELIADVARNRLRYERVAVRRQQIALVVRVVCGGCNRRDIPGVRVVVTLLKREARIAGSQALRLGLGEGHHSADVVAHLAGVEAACRDVPAEVRTERRVA